LTGERGVPHAAARSQVAAVNTVEDLLVGLVSEGFTTDHWSRWMKYFVYNIRNTN
jgi:hypothetical protein